MPRGKTRTILLILGMRNTGCRDVVTAALESVSGVTEVDVNLFRARATVVHEPTCSLADLLQAVHLAGYVATPVPA